MKVRTREALTANKTTKRKGSGLKIDPTRTATLRKRFVVSLRKRFSALKMDIVKLVIDHDAFGLRSRHRVLNAFCPTGEGGGHDNSCSPSAGTSQAIFGDLSKKVAEVKIAETKTKEKGVWQPNRFGHSLQFKTEKGTHYNIDAHTTEDGKGVTIFFDSEEGDTITGEGSAIEVFSKVITEVSDFVLQKSPAHIDFSAQEGSRQKLYDRLAKTVVKAVPGYKAYAKGGKTAGEKGPRKYVLVKDSGEPPTGFVVLNFNNDDLNWVANAFCPTGPGGGQDNSCKPSDAAGASKTASDELDRVASHVVIEPETVKAEYKLLELPKDAHVGRGRAHAALAGMYRSQFADRMHLVQRLVDAHVEAAEKHQRVAGSRAQIVEMPKRERSLVRNAPNWRFMPDPDKVRAFQTWLRTQVAKRLQGAAEEKLWDAYIRQAYEKGQGRAYDDATRVERASGREKLDFYRGSRRQFLRDSFRQPVAQERVKVLAGRSFDDLENVTTDMSTRITRSLVDGLIQGQNPREIAREMAEDVDLSRGRAELIARTEIIRAHAEGQLDSMERLGISEVGVQVEWTTANDLRVCDECSDMEGTVLSIADAHGLIPRHPNCRCAWLPAGDVVTQGD